MNIIYVTGNLESVQRHILEKMPVSGNQLRVFFYKERHYAIKESIPEGVRFYNSNSRLRGPLRLLKRLRMAAEDMEGMLSEQRVDILHGNMCFSDGYICRCIKQKYGIPYIVSVRDTDINLGFIWKLPWLRNQLYLNLTNASGIIFLSHSYKDKLLNKIPTKLKDTIESKTIVIPNGIDDFYLKNKYHRDSIPNEIKLIFVGKLQKRKNLELTVEATKKLINNGKKVTITAVGPIEDNLYRKLIDENDFITYYERCPKEEVIKFYRNSDIFVMPSHTESFGLTYAEAMSQGLPVVYTRNQGFDGQFDEGIVGYSVDDYSVDELVDCIQRIIKNYLPISYNCTKYANVFSWDDIVNRLSDFYTTSLNNKEGGDKDVLQ